MIEFIIIGGSVILIFYCIFRTIISFRKWYKQTDKEDKDIPLQPSRIYYHMEITCPHDSSQITSLCDSLRNMDELTRNLKYVDCPNCLRRMRTYDKK